MSRTWYESTARYEAGPGTSKAPHWEASLKIKTLLMLTVAVTVLVAASVISTGIYATSRANRAQQRLEISSELLEATFDRIALRSEWRLTHKDEVAIEWRIWDERARRLLIAAEKEFRSGKQLTELASLLEDQPVASEDFQELQDNWRAFESGAIDAATFQRIEDRVIGEMTELARAVVAFGSEIASESRRELDRAMGLGTTLPIVEVGLLALLLAAGAIVITVWVARGMGSILEGTQRVAAGDLDTRIDIRGKNEVAELTGSFNRMTERIKSKGEILEGFNLVFRTGLSSETEEEIVRACLSVAERLSGARFGFVGLLNERGLLDTKSLSEPGWEECVMPRSHAARLINDMELASFWGRAIKENASQLVNDPASDPDATGTPEGHPAITSFLGVPLRRGDEAAGIIALANKEGGFLPEDIEDLEALGAAFMEALGRHRAEAALREEHDLLEQLVTERTRELQEAMADLERSNAELQQYAYVASHDLQEPLRMVASYTQLLASRYKGKLDPDADEFIDFAVDGANRMQGLINDILALSRVDAGKREIKPTDSASALGIARANLEFLISETGAVVTNDDLPLVMADEAYLAQLFQNLLTNSLKFRSEDPPRVHVSARRKGGEWVFSVADNGIGFDPAYAERIFSVFQRLNPRSMYEGTGIGLAIGKKIVEQYGGKIWAESTPGEGSTFYFTLPVEDEAR